MSDRARGRARGQQDDQTRRPGEGAGQQQQAPPSSASPAPPPPAAGHPAASGRASYGGGATRERPGMASEDAKVPVEELSKMKIGTGDAKEVGKRRSDFRYTEPHTRPAHITDKQGTSGGQQPLQTNFFKLECAADWHMYQYHVDFNPPVESRKFRAALLHDHKELLGTTRAFDGMVLFLPIRLQQDVTEVFSTARRDNTQIRITITLTNELPPPHSVSRFITLFSEGN